MSDRALVAVVLGCVFVACLIVLWATRRRPPTVADQMQKLRDDIEAVHAEIGRALLPPVEAMARALNQLFKP